MPTTLAEAYREALASVPKDVVLVDTLSIEHPDQATIYLVKDFADFTAYLEDGVTEVTFEAAHFDFRIPGKDSNGVPELQVTIGNVDRRVSDYLEAVKLSEDPVELVLRPYLSNDTSGPQTTPPLRLQLRDVNVTLFQATGKAVFAKDLKNKKVPTQRYIRSRFPGLGR
jgi:hypothetical protein